MSFFQSFCSTKAGKPGERGGGTGGGRLGASRLSPPHSMLDRQTQAGPPADSGKRSVRKAARVPSPQQQPSSEQAQPSAGQGSRKTMDRAVNFAVCHLESNAAAKELQILPLKYPFPQ